jgi:hypothetical protein
VNSTVRISQGVRIASTPWKTTFTKKSATESLNLTPRSLTPKTVSPVSSHHHVLTFYLVELQNGFDTEVETRIEREKDIMQAVDDAKYALNKRIDAERTDKSLSLGKFKDDTLG